MAIATQQLTTGNLSFSSPLFSDNKISIDSFKNLEVMCQGCMLGFTLSSGAKASRLFGTRQDSILRASVTDGQQFWIHHS